MPKSTTDVLVPNDYSGKTVLWAKTDLGRVNLGIQVKRGSSAYHSPSADELGLVIHANAPGSKVGQGRPTGGNAQVILKMT